MLYCIHIFVSTGVRCQLGRKSWATGEWLQCPLGGGGGRKSEGVMHHSLSFPLSQFQLQA